MEIVLTDTPKKSQIYYLKAAIFMGRKGRYIQKIERRKPNAAETREYRIPD